MEEEVPITKLLSILELDSVNTSEILYRRIVNDVLTLTPNIKNNFIALCTDNGSNMISSRGIEVNLLGEGIANKFVKETPTMIHVRDKCHVYNLIVENTLDSFPLYII